MSRRIYSDAGLTPSNNQYIDPLIGDLGVIFFEKGLLIAFKFNSHWTPYWFKSNSSHLPIKEPELKDVLPGGGFLGASMEEIFNYLENTYGAKVPLPPTQQNLEYFDHGYNNVSGSGLITSFSNDHNNPAEKPALASGNDHFFDADRL